MNIIAVVKRSGKTHIHYGKNNVTYEGDRYYAQKIAGESTSFETPYLRLGYGETTPTKTDADVEDFVTNSNKELAAGFPERNNQDAGNGLGGESVITWKFVYDIGDLDAVDIAEGAIVDDGDNPTKALCRFLFDEKFTITSTDAVTIYVNHSLEGVEDE